jgi:O-antigen/teichoic acid export membrane protein
VRLRHTLPAGLLDAGLASLASFIVGVYAARSLPLSEFGAYALFFSAFILAAVVPAQLVLEPAAIATVSASADPLERLSLIRQTGRLGVFPGVVAALVVSAAAWLTAEAPADVLWPLAITTATCSVVSPLQDILRMILHMAGLSWFAALVSLVQLSSVVGGLFAFDALGVPTIWVPFGVLTVANIVSLAIGVTLAWSRLQPADIPRYDFRTLTRSGRWLLLQEVATASAAFISSALVTHLAGPEALANAEAARIVAHPIYVLTIGLSTVVWPLSVAAGATGSPEEASRVARPFALILVVAGGLYGAITATPWGGNLFHDLVPQAYEVRGLVPASVLAYVLVGIPFSARAELMGAGRLRTLARVGSLAAALQCLASGTASWIGSFARPLGLGLFGTSLAVGYGRPRHRIYAQPGHESRPGANVPNPTTAL